MPRPCQVCTHDQREANDRALVRPDASAAAVARQFGLHERAMRRHVEKHLLKAMAYSPTAREVAHADDLLSQVKALRTKAISLLVKAEQAGDIRTALAGVREARATLELLLRLEGELPDQQINIVLSPEWSQLRAVILAAVSPYPDARTAIIAAIEATNAR
jgi:transposase-like protein